MLKIHCNIFFMVQNLCDYKNIIMQDSYPDSKVVNITSSPGNWPFFCGFDDGLGSFLAGWNFYPTGNE